MPLKSTTLFLALAIVMLLLNISLALAQTAAQPSDPGARRPTVCTEQYAPVCGRLNDVLKTYSNACFARAAGADVVAQGECTGSTVRPYSR